MTVTRMRPPTMTKKNNRDHLAPTHMLIFLDTEFTDFVENPQLISLGMAADSGEYFYAEVTRELWYAEASEFVLHNVVPQLNGWGEPPAAIVTRLRAWLQRFTDVPAHLVFDSDYDWMLIGQLLEPFCWPARLATQPIRFTPWSNSSRSVRDEAEAARENFFARHGLEAHHALNDARALRESYQAAERAYSELLNRERS